MRASYAASHTTTTSHTTHHTYTPHIHTTHTHHACTPHIHTTHTHHAYTPHTYTHTHVHTHTDFKEEEEDAKKWCESHGYVVIGGTTGCFNAGGHTANAPFPLVVAAVVAVVVGLFAL